jgi:hypothetical protein
MEMSMQLALQHYDRKGERNEGNKPEESVLDRITALKNERLQQPQES